MTRWTWDEVKARTNLAKHGVSFELAMHVMNDPLALVRIDSHDDGDRLQTIGRPDGGGVLILIVVHTEPVSWYDHEVGRIISARAATKGERRAYEEGTF